MPRRPARCTGREAAPTGGIRWPSRRGRALDPANPGRALFSAFGISRPASSRGLLVAVFNAGALSLGEGAMRRDSEADGLTEDVRAIVEPEPGAFIAGTRFGIFESKAGQPFRQVLKLPSGFVMGLFKSPDGGWYAATSTAGVFVRDAGTWRPDEAINANLDNKHVRGMMWRRNGELWVATLRGISIFRDAILTGRLSSRDEKTIPESVNALLEVSDDEVWVGGTGGVAVSHGGKWRSMTEADGIPGQTSIRWPAAATGRSGRVGRRAWADSRKGSGRSGTRARVFCRRSAI